MGFLSSIFRSRDKLTDRTAGSSYRFFLGTSSSGKYVTERSAMQMTAHFLQESGKGFFVKREGAALVLREEMRNVAGSRVLAEHMKDVIEYRVMDYYQRRYREKETNY